MEIRRIELTDYDTVHNILTSNKITESQKRTFLQNNSAELKKMIEFHLTSKEFRCLMQARPLIKFKPLRNSFTKRGDKIFLANALDIDVSEVDSYIENVTEFLDETDKLSFLPPDKMDSLKTYVFRHGSKAQVITFLDYELTKAKDKIKAIERTLEYHTGGVADYFIRPIHRMDRNTFIKLYNVIDKHIHQAEENGSITEEDNMKAAKTALIKLYYIKHNNEFINAIKTYKTLSQN